MTRLLTLVFVLLAPSMTIGGGESKPQWLGSWSEAVRRAQRLRQPIFVRVTSATCTWCRKLDAELADAQLQAELNRWTLLHLDADKSEREELKPFEVAGLPTLRVMSPLGRRIAAFDGFMPAAELREWLQKWHGSAIDLPRDEQIAEGAPSAEDVRKLAAALSERDSVRREATVRRLIPYPAVAADAVAEAFASGSLQTRLAALDVLHEWRAPTDGMDPWRPATITSEKLQAIRKWAAGVQPAEPSAESKPLTAEQLATARQDLDRMAIATEAEAAAIRERLARYRSALMPEVLARLKDPPSDSIRDRLTALRYRLVARDALALSWPGGLERISSADATQRHEAIAELAELATAADEALLLELFASPDAIVREWSLRALHAQSGRSAAGALVKLLRDPELNVRAAVLKQLAERPSTNMVRPLEEFVATETDEDLVVHAVRALQAIPSPATMPILVSLFEHASWRVRAEAIEAVGKKLGERGEQDVADAETALIRAVSDSDGFVAARAVKALAHSHSPKKNSALVKLAETAPPALAAEAVSNLYIGTESNPKLIEAVQKLQQHPQPSVRVAAVKQLASAPPGQAVAALKDGLKDDDRTVRLAAAEGVRTILDAAYAIAASQEIRNSVGYLSPSMQRDRSKMPKWVAPAADWLRPLLTADTPEERLEAARSLIALGHDDDAIPVLIAVSREHRDRIDKSADALSWLPWDKRISVYEQLMKLDPTTAQRVALITGLTHDGDKKAIPSLWAEAAGDAVTGDLANALINALGTAYAGQQWRYRHEALDDKVRSAFVEVLTEKLAKGSELQRLVALVLLTGADSSAAAEQSARLFDDKETPNLLRLDAFHVRLATLPEAERNRAAIAALSHDDAAIRSAAVQDLAVDEHRSTTMLRKRTIWLNTFSVLSRAIVSRPSEALPFTPRSPKGLTPEPLKKLLADADDHTAGAAGYLLAVLGDDSGLDAILRYWRQSGGKDEFWLRLVTRTVTVLNDDVGVRYLEEIYRTLPIHDFDVPEFYWTIRGLEGPNALRLRKQIRKDVGMERLRNESPPHVYPP